MVRRKYLDVFFLEIDTAVDVHITSGFQEGFFLAW